MLKLLTFITFFFSFFMLNFSFFFILNIFILVFAVIAIINFNPIFAVLSMIVAFLLAVLYFSVMGA